MELRDDGPESEILEPYQPPRLLTRQAKIDGSTDQDQMPAKPEAKKHTDAPERKTWISRLSSGGSKTRRDLRSKITRRIARLSSLDSTRSSSSVEDSTYNQRQSQHTTMPLISITSNENGAAERAADETAASRRSASGRPGAGETASRQISSVSQRRADYYGRSSYDKSRRGQSSGRRTNWRARLDERDHGHGHGHDREEEDDDDDAFEDAPLPVPYSSSSMARTVVVRQQTERGISYPGTNYNRRLEELLDDRQGMNSSEQQFTKAEKQANRPSLDGSIVSNEFRADPKSPAAPARAANKLTGSPGPGKREKRRSKSPTSMFKTRRQSRRGFLGLASRLKLTKKHESIAKLQLSIMNSGFVSLKTLDRDLQSFLPRERLAIRDFQERIKLMRKFEVLSTIEYRFASKYETYVCKHAQMETNQPKNNYKKCIPYDYNRIVLRTLPNVPDSDYINASHVDSCLKPNAYIAAQGPNEFTIEDFWRMVWEQKTFVIVMLTKVFDFIRVMCNQYWPVELNKPERYGGIEVTLLYEEPLADFVIRTIRIAKLKSNQPAQTPEIGANGPETGASLVEAATQRRPLATESRGAGAGGPASEDDCCLDNYSSDGTSASSALEDDDGNGNGNGEDDMLGLSEFATPTSRQSLSVRAPRFVASASPKRGASRERSLPSKTPRAPAMRRTSSQADLGPQGLATPASANEGAAGQTSGRLSSGQKSPLPPSTNEFLHPLFSAHRQQLDASWNSLSSEPGTPMTQRTPSSAGLDRSSATRRAVKKKRRERVKNQRPRRTQFMVPTESQLLDDDDDYDYDEMLTAGTGAEPASAEPARSSEARSKRAGQPAGRSAGKSNERIIYQFHYNSWASHTCPFISSLLHFRRRVRICMDEMSKSGRTGPTVVHCNDGCGRTGAYLCIDANLELAEEDNVIDIYNYTRKMRQSRKYLIENLEQYKFVYDTIEEALYCGKTWFPVSELHKRLKHKSQRSPITRKNEYLLEYEKICRMTSKFSIGDCAGGHRVENREKNRDVSTVPPDNFRPYLSSFQTNDSTDYINAVFVDGYTRSKEYIVTEWPLHRTISDFWSLIYDHDCNSVILLANPGESSTYPSFLPSEKELRRKFGPVFSAEMVSYTHYQNIKSWIYTINKKIVSLTEVIAGVKSEAKTTQVFQITCWPQGHRVPTSTNALVELMNMVERWRQRTTYGPVCVVSLNGKSRAGVYCAANVAIEQVVQHSEVDVFNAVKTVRRHRPHLIENMTEYKYCYDLILHYVLHYVNNQTSANN